MGRERKGERGSEREMGRRRKGEGSEFGLKEKGGIGCSSGG